MTVGTKAKVNFNLIEDNQARTSARKMYSITLKLIRDKLRPKLFGLPSNPIFSNFFDGIPPVKTLDMGCLEFELEFFKQNIDKIKQVLSCCKADLIREKEYKPKSGQPVMRLLLDLKKISR